MERERAGHIIIVCIYTVSVVLVYFVLIVNAVKNSKAL